MKIERTVVAQQFIQEAVLGARESYGSGERSDTTFEGACLIGPNDTKLLHRLVLAGAGHDKFLRTIPVSCFVTATTVWWRQFDQHKIGTTTQSASLMHRLAGRGPFQAADFGGDNTSALFQLQLKALNTAYAAWTADGNTRRGALWEAVQDKVMANYLYRRHLACDYAVLRNVVQQRRNHRWGEWQTFLDWIDTLPHSWLITLRKGDADANLG